MHFYYLPSRKTMILWSEKCACSSLVYWIEHNFQELSQCPGKPRAYLNKEGYNYNQLGEASEFLANNAAIEHLIVSHRDPIKRMASSFVNKFLIRGEQGHILPLVPQKLQRFSKDFLETFDSLQRKNRKKNRTQKSRKRKTNHASIIMKLSLKKFVSTITHPTTDRDALNGHFSPQITNQSQWDDYSKIVDASKAVYPLRVESFDQDLERINQSMGLDNFLPEKKNSTRLPNEDWTFSEQVETSVFNLAELCEMKTVPKGASLHKLLRSKSNLDNRFKDTFQFDYQLAQHLNHLSNSR